MADIRNMIIGFILAGLFALCFIAFVFQTTMDNNPNSSLLNDSRLNTTYQQLNKSLNTFQDIAQTQKNATYSENMNPISTAFGIVSFAIIGAGRIFANMIVAVWGIMTSGIFTIIQIPTIVIGVIFAIIMITIIFLLWKNWRQGE